MQFAPEPFRVGCGCRMSVRFRVPAPACGALGVQFAAFLEVHGAVRVGDLAACLHFVDAMGTVLDGAAHGDLVVVRRRHIVAAEMQRVADGFAVVGGLRAVGDGEFHIVHAGFRLHGARHAGDVLGWDLHRMAARLGAGLGVRCLDEAHLAGVLLVGHHAGAHAHLAIAVDVHVDAGVLRLPSAHAALVLVEAAHVGHSVGEVARIDGAAARRALSVLYVLPSLRPVNAAARPPHAVSPSARFCGCGW